MERAFHYILDQHLITAFSACQTLYIGARSVKTRSFPTTSPHLSLSCGTVTHYTSPSRGLAQCRAGTSDSQKIYTPQDTYSRSRASPLCSHHFCSYSLLVFLIAKFYTFLWLSLHSGAIFGYLFPCFYFFWFLSSSSSSSSASSLANILYQR